MNENEIVLVEEEHADKRTEFVLHFSSEEKSTSFLSYYSKSQVFVDSLKGAFVRSLRSNNTILTPPLVYDIPLDQLMKTEREKGNTIPSLVTKTITNLKEANAHHVEGLLRISGAASQIFDFYNAVNQGGDIEFDGLKLHSITGVFKLFFRRLPEPIMSFELFEEFQLAHGTYEPER